MWPTPTQSDGTGGPGNSGRDGGLNLRTAVALTKDGLWTTPCADDTGARKDKYPQGGTALSTQVASEQRRREHPDALHLLPSLLACDCGATRVDRAGTASAAANRVDRLRALGNALVPQIAQWIGERILEWEAVSA